MPLTVIAVALLALGVCLAAGPVVRWLYTDRESRYLLDLKSDAERASIEFDVREPH